MRACQSRRLIDMVERVYHNVPFYRQKMQELGLHPEDIKGIDDLKRLPFTTKQDLRDNYPFGLFAVPQSEIVRVHASSGTTGKPTVVGYTRRDLNTWSEVVARCLVSAGAHKHDIVHIAYGYGLFTGGLGLHYGSERIGATVIPISGGNTKRQLQIMHDFGSTILACTPSYALYLAEALEEEGVKREEYKLRVGIFGAEPWTDAMRGEIESRAGIDALDIYGLSEIMGPGVAAECIESKDGPVIWEDHFYPEIIDPDTGRVLPEGEKGELVFTSLTKEALPMIRYRTRDLTRLLPPTARAMRRIEKITGRSDDMLIIRGVNVYPTQVEAALLELPELTPNYRIVVTRGGTLDEAEVEVEVSEMFLREAGVDSLSEEHEHVRALRGRAEHRLRESIGCSFSVTFMAPDTLPRSEGGKLQRVLDRRTLA